MIEDIKLQQKGAKWYRTEDHHSPNNSKASLGLFFNTVLSTGAQIGQIWLLNKHQRSAVYVYVFMTKSMKEEIESKTKFRFKLPDKIHLN